MPDTLDLQSEIESLKLLPQYSGMTDDMIRQMILQEMPQENEPLTSGDFGLPMDNQINYGSSMQYPSMAQSDFDIQQQPLKFNLGETLGNLKNIYKNIGNKGQAHVKDILGIMPEASVAEKAIQAGEMMGPSLADAGLQMSNIGKAVPVGTSGLSSLLSKIGLKGQAAATSAGTGSSLISALGPAAIMVGAGLYLRSRKKKKAMERRMEKERKYNEAREDQRMEKLEGLEDYLKMANKYQNPYNID
jgi:hypothetical protein